MYSVFSANSSILFEPYTLAEYVKIKNGGRSKKPALNVVELREVS